MPDVLLTGKNRLGVLLPELQTALCVRRRMATGQAGRAPPAADAADTSPTRYASDTGARKPHSPLPRVHTHAGTLEFHVSKMLPSRGSEAPLLKAEQGRRASWRQTARDQQTYKEVGHGATGSGVGPLGEV